MLLMLIMIALLIFLFFYNKKLFYPIFILVLIILLSILIFVIISSISYKQNIKKRWNENKDSFVLINDYLYNYKDLNDIDDSILFDIIDSKTISTYYNNEKFIIDMNEYSSDLEKCRYTFTNSNIDFLITLSDDKTIEYVYGVGKYILIYNPNNVQIDSKLYDSMGKIGLGDGWYLFYVE